MKNRYLIYFFLLSYGMLKAEVGCMDNSKHLDTSDGPDYKGYHYVYCTCPCDHYKHSFNRGRCEICLHYRTPKKIEFVKWRES